MNIKEMLKRKLNESLNIAQPEQVSESDDVSSFNPTKVGYKAGKTGDFMTPEEVMQRAQAYINSYKSSGYSVADVSTNADGSVVFTTTKDGKIKHHTFHKTGSHKSVDGGTTTAGEDDLSNVTQKDPNPEKEKRGRGRPSGSVGAAKRAQQAATSSDQGKSLQDILMGRVMQTPSKFVKKVKGKATQDDASHE